MLGFGASCMEHEELACFGQITKLEVILMKGCV